ncbi:transmembrane channel-like protein 5 isoform X2 [Oncorhynchus kisutch]|uniref:transmembrane channel-like protein 5 isoform X2 n=1 Tax=Oncorhynchus kisutch TaxID=8019 RepID=UPI0012DC8224|nr:transmembrane channel-like protein 5 isoform X2 [Oncorhynchus kisutch]
MSHYNNTGVYNNPAYHDSDTLEIDRSPSRKSQSHHSNPHGNPYPRDDGAGGQRGRSDLQQLPGGVQSSYNDAQERVPWGGWQEGSWRGRDSIPMGLLPPRSDSPRWQQHDLNHSGYQIEQETHYDTTPPVRLPSATSGHVSMRFRGSRKMSLFPVGEAALGNLGLSEDDIRNEMENEEQNLVKELVAMSTRDTIKAIRDLPMSFDDKKHIRGQVLALKSFKKSRQLNCFSDCSTTISLAFRRCGANMTLAKQTLELWRGTMKEVGGKFGTGVLSYFKFLKWLLMFNIFSFLVNFGFITIPQLIYHPTPDIPAGVSFKGLEILTGAGYFSHTVMYYGGYSNKTQGTGGRSEYNMQLAYFFTIAAYMVLCGAALIYSMASSFRKKYVLADSGLGGAWQLLCSWDFSVTNEKAVRQRKNNLRIQLKESLSEKVQVALLPLTERMKHYGVFLGTWLLSTGMALGCGASVYFLCQYDTWRTKQSPDKASGSLLEEAATLLLPFVVSLINLVVPLFYSLFKKIEHYSNPRMQVYAIIVRNVILKMSILGILCSYWMKDVANTFSCWESIVGQALYRLVIMDFLFIMLGSFFGEFLSNVIGTKCIQSLGVPEFDVARNVLDLIYAQTLAWIGIYFSPLLPVIQIIKFFILFYLKKVTCSVWFFYLKKVTCSVWFFYLKKVTCSVRFFYLKKVTCSVWFFYLKKVTCSVWLFYLKKVTCSVRFFYLKKVTCSVRFFYLKKVTCSVWFFYLKKVTCSVWFFYLKKVTCSVWFFYLKKVTCSVWFFYLKKVTCSVRFFYLKKVTCSVWFFYLKKVTCSVWLFYLKKVTCSVRFFYLKKVTCSVRFFYLKKVTCSVWFFYLKRVTCSVRFFYLKKVTCSVWFFYLKKVTCSVRFFYLKKVTCSVWFFYLKKVTCSVRFFYLKKVTCSVRFFYLKKVTCSVRFFYLKKVTCSVRFFYLKKVTCSVRFFYLKKVTCSLW